MSRCAKRWVSFMVVVLVSVGSISTLWLTVGATDGTVVQIRVEGQTQTLFDGEVVIGDCLAQDDSGADHALSGVALCGLVTIVDTESIELSLQDYGFGLFVAGIGADIMPADWSWSWSFWVNDEPAAMGADTYQAVLGDELLFAFSGYPTVPLRAVAPEKVLVGEPISVLVEKRIGEYDASYNWQGQWVAAENVKVWANNHEATTNESGLATWQINDPGVIDIWAEGEGLVRSARQQVIVEEVAQETVIPTPSPVISPSISPSTSATPVATINPEPVISVVLPSPVLVAGGLSSTEERHRVASAALNYLRNRVGEDGKIEGDVVTAWSAMAFGADGQQGNIIKGTGESLWVGLLGAKLSSATDLERQIMAVRAVGGNPWDWQGRNLVQELRGYLRGGQMGEATIINDDIFGLLAWLAAEQSVTSSEVEQTVRVIIANQDENGAWGSIDLTAAAIQGLSEYAKQEGQIEIALAMERARTYLRSHQDKYGGFGENLASTAWGIQAVISLGEDPAAWVNQTGETLWGALARYQNSNGGFGWQSDKDVSSFMTAYAVPALLGKTWPIKIGAEVVGVEDEAQNFKAAVAGSSVLRREGTLYASVSPQVTVTSMSEESFLARQNDTVRQEESNIIADREGEVAGANNDVGAQKLIQPHKRDWQFVFSLFSLANIGIGATVARLLIKI